MKLGFIASLMVALALAFGLILGQFQYVEELIFDTMIAPKGQQTAVVVVDIGADDETGAAWDRHATARLIRALAKTNPQVVGFDILFSGDCETAGAQDLGQAIATVPAILGFLLTNSPSASLPPTRLAIAGRPALWPAAGMDAPCPNFATAELASIALMGDADGQLRRVPLGVLVGERAYPSLAIAIAARANGGRAVAGDDWLRFGGAAALPVVQGQFRVPLASAKTWPSRSVDAAALLRGDVQIAPKAVVLIGSSLPERGGLRTSPASPVTPSVQFHADAVIGLMSGDVPRQPAWARLAQGLFLAIAGLGGLILAQRIRPTHALIATLITALLWALGAFAAYKFVGILIDPVLPSLFLIAIVLLGLTARAAFAARAEKALRARMGQILPPSLVARIAANPHLMQLKGETREITALFTDIEGFSAATVEMGAEEMVAKLEAYFALSCAIVLRHGGMIDKLVGDSIHALFNAPLDQADHQTAALNCARDLIVATETFRAQQGGFGRTRIGIETGTAILGDIGFGLRIDYTAHGPAVNLAARLQEVNKDFGTQICIGPCLGGRNLPNGSVMPLGLVNVRSFGALDLFTLKV